MHFINPFKGLRPTEEKASSVSIPSTDHLSEEIITKYKKNNPWSYLNIFNNKILNKAKEQFELMKSNSIRGSIVNVGSIYGKVSPRQDIYDHIETPNGKYKKPLVYGVSKSALTNFTKYLATYWGENGIRVNNVILGGVMNNQDTELVEKYSKNVPLGRMANIDECISPILFLLSDSSSYITGSDLIVDGGWTSW